jgi:hypothetical protein
LQHSAQLLHPARGIHRRPDRCEAHGFARPDIAENDNAEIGADSNINGTTASFHPLRIPKPHLVNDVNGGVQRIGRLQSGGLGTPKSAMSASPENFSMEPRCAKITFAIRR